MESRNFKLLGNINIFASLAEFEPQFDPHQHSQALQTSRVQGFMCETGWVVADGNEGVSDFRKISPFLDCHFTNSSHC